MAEEEKKSANENPEVLSPKNTQPDAVSEDSGPDDEFFVPLNNEISLFFKKNKKGELTNILNIDKDVNKIIKTADWMKQVNTLLKDKIRDARDMAMVDTLINEGGKIGCKVYNPIMKLFWGSSPSLIKLKKIKELLDNVHKRVKICDSTFQKAVYHYLPDPLAYNCIKGLAAALYECGRYGIFEQDDIFENAIQEGRYSYAPFSLEQLREAQNYWIKLAVAESLRSSPPIAASEAQILEERSNMDVNQKDQEVIDENKQIQKTLDQIKTLYLSLNSYSNPDEPQIKMFIHNQLTNHKIYERYNKVIQKMFQGTFQEKIQEVDQMWKSIENLDKEVTKMETEAKRTALAKSKLVEGPRGGRSPMLPQRRR